MNIVSIVSQFHRCLMWQSPPLLNKKGRDVSRPAVNTKKPWATLAAHGLYLKLLGAPNHLCGCATPNSSFQLSYVPFSYYPFAPMLLIYYTHSYSCVKIFLSFFYSIIMPKAVWIFAILQKRLQFCHNQMLLSGCLHCVSYLISNKDNDRNTLCDLPA
jgi:hypothetical protein